MGVVSGHTASTGLTLGDRSITPHYATLHITPLMWSSTLGVPIGGLISIGLQAHDHTGNGPRVIDHGLHHLPNGVISAGTKESQEFAIEAKVLSD